MYAIEIDNLHKSYDDLVVLQGLDLRVPQGQVYGLLGPNGAGKTTLIHLMLGFLQPDRGRIRLLGESDLEWARARAGYVPERLRYHMRYSGREYLRYLGAFSDIREPQLSERVDELLRAFGLPEVADRPLGTYSKGMLQRLGIAQALLTDPEIVLIDEPTAGLDPSGQREMLDLLSEMRGRGHTIFLASPVIEEVEQLCDTAGILFGGALVAEIDASAMRAPGRDALIKVAALPPDLTMRLRRLSPAVRCEDHAIVLRPNSPALQAQVLRALLDAEVPIIALEPHGRPLEELYVRIIRGEFADAGEEQAAIPERPASGDTLLRELLEHEQRDGQDSEQRL